MTHLIKAFFLLIAFIAIHSAYAQDNTYQINTIFKPSRTKANGGFGAITNKFTTIDGQYANMVEVYGGWFINHRFLLGAGMAAVTNNLEVPVAYRTIASENMNYAYGQFGLVTEYTLWSHRAVHLSFHLLSGTGFTAQYIKNDWDKSSEQERLEYDHEENWFFVAEPGIKIEMNVLKWMRFSPGISYRYVNGSGAKGLSDSALSDYALNLTLKFGKF